MRKEKEAALANIQSEIKKYDLEELKQDVQHKAATIANNLKKAERQLAADENRNLRQLDKVEQMQKNLAEDF